MTAFCRALVRRLFFFLAGLSFSHTVMIAGTIAFRHLAPPRVRLPEPAVDFLTPVDLALRAPMFGMLATFLFACACICAATYVEHRYPLAPATS